MQVKQWIIRPVSHEPSVHMLIRKFRRLNGRLHPCGFVTLLHPIKDPAGSS